jgi:anti-sigma factor RsiW
MTRRPDRERRLAGRDPMACRELVELVTEYLELSLDAAERARFEAHLEECPPCRVHLEQVRATIAAAGRPRPDGLPAALRERLRAEFVHWRGLDM